MAEENKEEVPAAPVTVKALEKRLNEFQEKVDGGLNAIMEQLSSLTKPSTKPAEIPEIGSPDAQNLVPEQWRKTVHQILGPEFDCEVIHMDSGGVKFKIHVPKDKSNATKDYWNMHGRDIRTIEVSKTGLTGVKEYCLRVRANLLKSEIQLVKYP